MRIWILGLLCLISYKTDAARYELSRNCQKAYEQAWRLRLNEADKLIAAEKATNPDNRLIYYAEDVADFLKVFASEEKKEYEAYLSARSARLSQLDKAKSESPWRDYARAEILLHSALLKFKFNDYLSAAYDIQRAFHTLEGLIEQHPDFLPAKKDYYLLTAAVGTVPDNYKWLLKILGFNGDLNRSMEKYAMLIGELKQSEEYGIFLPEAEIFYGYMLFYLSNDAEGAWEQIRNGTTDYELSPIKAFVRASMAMRLKLNEQAISTLRPHVISNTPTVPHLDYLMGNALLYKLNKESAFHLGRYIKDFKGHNYIKDAYLKLGWAFLLQGDKDNYRKCIQLLGHYGSDALEEDRYAKKEAGKDISERSLELLKSRLYYDGGYYKQAYNLLQEFEWQEVSQAQQAEYWYRRGRVADAMNLKKEAYEYYSKTYENYSNVQDYFPPAACVYAANIKEKEGDFATAKRLYEKCLSYKSYIYKDAFDQKAYAGLRRLDKK